MVDEFTKDGYWTQETFYDFWDRNAREFGDQEALVDSKYRLTWAEAKRLVDAMAISWVEMGIPKFARMIIQSPNSVYGFLARIASKVARPSMPGIWISRVITSGRVDSHRARAFCPLLAMPTTSMSGASAT